MKILKKIADILGFILLFCMLASGIAVIVLNITGHRLLAIETGSMEPKYKVGSMVVVKKCDGEDISIGDVISFVANDQLTVVTHRVVDIDEYNRCFYTKGDMNITPDNMPVIYENLIGRVICGIPLLGYIVIFAKSTLGKILIAAIICLIIFFWILEFIRNKVKRREAHHEEAGHQNKTE
jgi:signal peptidase I